MLSRPIGWTLGTASVTLRSDRQPLASIIPSTRHAHPASPLGLLLVHRLQAQPFHKIYGDEFMAHPSFSAAGCLLLGARRGP